MARGIRRFALAALVMVVVSPGAAAAVPTSVTPPGVPKVLRVTSTIEGVELVWSAADYVAGQPAPTSWTVRRSASEEDKAWTIANTSGLGSVTLRDDELPAGSQAEYTVTALADGVEGTPSPPVHGVHVADPGPFSPARRALTMTWDREDGSHKSAALLDTTGNPPIVTPVFTGVGLSDVTYGGRSYVSLPWPIEDGSYQVGTGPGLVEVIARAEAGCNQPSGIVTVRHAAPSRTGWWKSLTVDADLECDDGFHLRIEGRFATPEGVSAVSGPATTTIGTSAGTTATREIEVRNTGDEPVSLGSARIVHTGQLDPSGVVNVAGSTCQGTVLAPAATCRIGVTQARPTDAGVWARYAGRLVVETGRGEVGVGTVIGTAEDELMGPQKVTATGRPGRTVVSWATGGENGSSTYTVLDSDGRTLGTSTSSPVTLNGLAPGAHDIRVRQTVDDGRVYTSALRRLVVPAEWVFVSSGSGVRAYGVEADAASADGLLVGESANPQMTNVHLSASPTRSELAAADVFDPRVHFFNDHTVLGRWTPATTVGVGRPRYRPDGAVLAVQRPGVTQGEVQVQSPAILLRDRASGAVTEVPGSSTYFLTDWAPDGASLLVIPMDGPGLYRMNPSTGAVTPVPGASDVYDAAVSRQGRLLVVRLPGGSILWEYSLTGGVAKDLGIYVYGSEFSWDPTGTRVAIGSQAWSSSSTGSLWDFSTATPRKIRDLPKSTSIAWWDPQSSAPEPKTTVPSWTSASPTLSIAATDPDDAPGGLSTACRLDAATAWTPCSGAFQPGTLSAGAHTVTVRATDPSGRSGESSATWKVDPAAPSTSTTALPSATLTTSIPVSWSATDSGGSGVSRYDLRYRRASTSSGLGSYTYPTALQGTTARSTTLAATAGYQYCISVRARDVAGNVGSWSAERCTVVALDDRSLAAGKGWSRGTSAAYVYTTYSRTTTGKASLTRTGVSARRVGLVVTTCSTCGSLDVWVGGTYAGRVSLVSSTWRTRQVKWLPAFASTKTGTLTIRATTSKTSVVDAALVSH